MNNLNIPCVRIPYGKVALFFLIFVSCSSIHDVPVDETTFARVKSQEEVKFHYGPVDVYPDMELVHNAQVDKFIKFYSARSKTIKVSLERRMAYNGIIESLFHQFGVPETLVNVALIESNFNPDAKSPAGAKGLWQFMGYTAKKYGLVVNDVRDDRLNVELSTKAACMYMVDLYHMFDDWYLALAAYNAGPTRVRKAVREGKTKDYWALVQKGLLSKENSEFVAKVIAVTVISRDLEKYGITVAQWEQYLAMRSV